MPGFGSRILHFMEIMGMGEMKQTDTCKTCLALSKFSVDISYDIKPENSIGLILNEI